RDAPADQKQRKQHAAVVADVARRSRNARPRQQLGERGHEHERINERVHAVERPSTPRGPEAAHLIWRERRRPRGASREVRHLAELTTTLFESVARVSDGFDVIVGSGVQMASPSVAEWRGVPSAMAVFCPCAVPSADAPPPPVKTHALPRWMNRLLWDIGGP